MSNYTVSIRQNLNSNPNNPKSYEVVMLSEEYFVAPCGVIYYSAPDESWIFEEAQDLKLCARLNTKEYEQVKNFLLNLNEKEAYKRNGVITDEEIDKEVKRFSQLLNGKNSVAVKAWENLVQSNKKFVVYYAGLQLRCLFDNSGSIEKW